MTTDYEPDEQTKLWLAEIDAVEAGILRWMNNQPLQARIAQQMIETAHALMFQEEEIVFQGDWDSYSNAVCNSPSSQLWNQAHDLMWKWIDADNWLGENYSYSDIWICALEGAISKFGKEDSHDPST